MIKFITVNKKKIPVPVPIRTFGEALDWLEQTLVPEGHAITRISLDGVLIGEQGLPGDNDALSARSDLDVQIDSPVALAIQTLDATRDLASIVCGGLKTIAVQCWQAKPIDKPEGVAAVTEDCGLVLELIDHLEGLLDPDQVETAPIYGIAKLLERASTSLSLAVSQSDWRAVARILLNRLEPLFQDLMNEAESLQIRVLALQGHKSLAKAGSL